MLTIGVSVSTNHRKWSTTDFISVVGLIFFSGSAAEERSVYYMNVLLEIFGYLGMALVLLSITV